MQVFVRRSDLTLDSVPVFASYDDDPAIDPMLHGNDMAMLILPPTAIIMSAPAVDLSTVGPELANRVHANAYESDLAMKGPVLAKDWRNMNRQQIASTQATKRIEDVFPEYSQRNSTVELMGYMTKYGADVSKWPSAAQSRKAEIDRCWNYINAVRAKATAMAKTTLPSDPTANSNWPTVISPYQPQ